MRGFDEMREPQVRLGPDRHIDMATFRSRDHAPPRGFVNRGRVEPGARRRSPVSRPPRRRSMPADDGAQVLGSDMAQGMALRLKIVQNSDDLGAGGAGQRGAINGPVEVGHASPRHSRTGPAAATQAPAQSIPACVLQIARARSFPAPDNRRCESGGLLSAQNRCHPPRPRAYWCRQYRRPGKAGGRGDGMGRLRSEALRERRGP